MANKNLIILTMLLLAACTACRQEKDWSRGEYLLVSADADEEGTYCPSVNVAKEGTYTLYVKANVDYTMKFESTSLEKDWVTLEGKRHDAATGLDVITYKVSAQDGAPLRRSGTISLMAPDYYLANFITVSQGFESRTGSDFKFLQYGSANPLEGIAGRPIAQWNDSQLNQGWTSTVGDGQDQAWCYGRNGFLQLGDDAGHGADLFTPYEANLRRDTVLLVYLDAAAYADRDGVRDDVTLTMEVTGGGEFLDGGKVKTFKAAPMDPEAEDVATDMWKDKGHSYYIVSQPGNMISATTRVRIMDGDYTLESGNSRVFIDNFYLFTIPHEQWEPLIGGLDWVDAAEKKQ